MASHREVIGQRIHRARLSQNLSLDELVERMDRLVTKAALSKYERGQAIPRPTVLLRLGEALRLPASHFLGTEHANDAHITWLAYRKHSRLGAREQARIQALAEHRVEAFVHLIRLLHPEFTPRMPDPRPAATADDAETAANAVREHWGLGGGPIERLTQFVEDVGAIVVEGPTADHFDALSGRTNSRFAVVVLNLTRSLDRIRFNLAHELGHLLLSFENVESKVEERLAHRFAAAFLVPAEAARRELGTRRATLSTTELECLKQKYGFSVAAWTRRARDLSIISDTTYREWQVWIRSQGQYVRESAIYAGDERPQRMRVLCTQALAERMIDRSWIQAHCPEVEPPSAPGKAAQPSAIRYLIGLPPDQRSAILETMAKRAAPDYERDPEVREWLEFDDPIEPGDGEKA